MSKFVVWAYAEANASREREPWLEDIRELETDSVEVEADSIEEMKKLAWELLEDETYAAEDAFREEHGVATYGYDWELWWEEA